MTLKMGFRIPQTFWIPALPSTGIDIVFRPLFPRVYSGDGWCLVQRGQGAF